MLFSNIMYLRYNKVLLPKHGLTYKTLAVSPFNWAYLTFMVHEKICWGSFSKAHMNMPKQLLHVSKHNND